MKKSRLFKKGILLLGLLGLIVPFGVHELNAYTTSSFQVVEAASYTLTANANGGTISSTSGWTGTGATATKSLSSGSAYGTLPIATKTGHKLNGWFTASTGGTKVTTSTTMGSSKKTIYAQWTANLYPVSFDQQSGTGGTSSINATYGSAMPSITIPTRSGYSFKGYYTELDGAGTKYYSATGTSARVCDFTSAKKLYACWIANLYTVTLDQQSGTGGTSSVNATYGSAMPSISIYNLPTRTGYTFQGYYSETDGAGTKYYSENGTSAHIYDITSSTTLYAYWIAKQYTINYLDKGGAAFSGTHESGYPTSHTYGTDTSLKSATKTAYSFGGWYLASDCSGSPITTLEGTGYSNNITLYAKWEEDTEYKPTATNQIGGWIMDEGKKKQIIAFGFEVTSTVYNSLVNDSDFGIIAYQQSASQVEYSNGQISSLKTNQGRFYMYIIVDSNVSATYYAKAFVKYNGLYIYSDIVNATGDLSGAEYIL